uniref:ParB-like N-terminal domain-containing protein n=1 Tax=Biomphalaria glabrata TaxID=6526 RepID=A0A2C9JR49_BIOGL
MATATKLGKGLDKLFGQNIEETIETIQRVNKHEKLLMSIEKIERNPYQPRKFFDEEKIDELANSIREHGIFTPILLRKTLNDIYYIVAGERRFRAAKKVGLKEVPAIVLDIDDKKMMEISLIENIQRQDLNIIEEAKAYKSMMEKLILTQEELAKTVGKHRVHIANTLRILNLHLEIQNMVEMGDLTMGHVKPIMAISDEELAIKIARNAKEKKQTVREVEQIVQGYKLLESKKNSPKQELNHDYDFLSNIAGLVKGASEGKGLGNKFLSNIREVDAICEVVRCFENKDILHVEGRINPLDDLKIISFELILSDMETVNNAIQKIERKAKNAADKEVISKYEAFVKARKILEEEKLI